MNCPEYTEQAFIGQFPEFAEAQNIELYIDRALLYFDRHCWFCKNRKQYAVFLLAAHFLALQDNINSGENAGGIQTGASIDRVSVSIAPPPFSDATDYYFNQTVYGQEFLAFLDMIAVLPGFIGGSFNRVLR